MKFRLWSDLGTVGFWVQIMPSKLIYSLSLGSDFILVSYMHLSWDPSDKKGQFNSHSDPWMGIIIFPGALSGKMTKAAPTSFAFGAKIHFVWLRLPAYSWPSHRSQGHRMLWWAWVTWSIMSPTQLTWPRVRERNLLVKIGGHRMKSLETGGADKSLL